MKKVYAFIALVLFIVQTSAAQAQGEMYVSQPNESAGIDTILGQKNPSTNFGSFSSVNVGEQDDDTDLARGLIKFALPSAITVESASLCLYQTSENSSVSTIISIYRMKRAWSETSATWNSAGSEAWQSPGAGGVNDAESSPIGVRFFSSTEANGEKCFFLSAVSIQQMVDGTFVNNGFLIKADGELNNLYRFCSSSCSVSSQRPKLVITYISGTGTATPEYTATVMSTPTVTATFTPIVPVSNSINSNPSNTWVIPIIGQSNASGRGENKSQVIDPNVLMFGNDYLYRYALEPSDSPMNQVDAVSLDANAGYGFATTLAKEIQDANPSKVVVVVQCSKGATSMGDWQRSYADDTLYGSCLKRIRATLGEVVLIAISQGETDAINYSDAYTWDWKFSQLVNALRADIGVVPIIFTQLPEHADDANYPYWNTVRQKQAAFSMYCVEMVETVGLSMIFPHFTTSSYESIGNNIALTWSGMGCQ